MQRRAVTCPNRRCQPAWCRGHHRRARPVHCALPYPLTDRDLMPSPAATGAGVSRQRTHPQSLRAVSTGARARPAPVRRWTGRLGRRRTALGRRRRPPWECAAVRQPGSAGVGTPLVAGEALRAKVDLADDQQGPACAGCPQCVAGGTGRARYLL